MASVVVTSPAGPVEDPSTAPLPKPSAAPGGTVIADVVYRVVPGYRPLVLDLHRPPVPDPAPLVVLLHGGGWITGSRRRFCPTVPGVVDALLEAELAVAAVDYRLSGEAIFPAQLHDVRSAVRWLRHRSAELQIAPDRISVWGESAGGHLAALLALHGIRDRLLDETDPLTGSSAIERVVDWFGPSDLLTGGKQARDDAVADSRAPDSRESMLLGAPVETVAELARAASPVTHVHAGAPPFLLAHGTADRFVPFAQSSELHDALRQAGVAVTLHAVPGADHLWRNAEDPQALVAEAIAFLVGDPAATRSRPS